MNKPLLIYGAGIQSCRAEAIAFAEKHNIPVALTWGAADLLPVDHKLRVGTFGTHGNKFANLAVQNADFIICVGSRLDTKATGFPVSGFAPNAELWMVDVDAREMEKMEKLGRNVTALHITAERFFKSPQGLTWNNSTVEWRLQIADWKVQYPEVLQEWRKSPDIHPYAFVEALSSYLSVDDVIVSDTGCSLAWMMQAYRFDGQQRFIHQFNQTPMGCGLGLAVGAAFATGKRVICITGDGGLSLGRAELTTIYGNDLPVKIILFSNGSHAMCMGTQRQWFDGEYATTSEEGGLHFPDFVKLAKADHIQAESISQRAEIPAAMGRLLRASHPALLELNVDRMIDVYGQIKFGESLA
jgi:acetolactate synthase I/II/III large subunit